MQLFFLSAGVPLTKSFTLDANGSIQKSAYPMVKNFTSHEVKVDDAEQFAAAMREHAAQGHCLLKGMLSKPLVKEPRAGSTQPMDPSQWSCFDLDNITGLDSIEQFVQTILPPAFRDVDYVLQHSASAGVTSDKGVRAHVMFLHDKTFTPEQAKLLITEINLTNELLAGQLELTAAGTALRFRLDRTVCQNDKLIYIANPVLGEGVVDSLGPDNRITVVAKAKKVVSFDWVTALTPPAIQAAVEAKVEALRETLQLPRKRARYRMMHGEQVLLNPDQAVVTGEREARGFVYLNLNGGDSWGYYYYLDRPKYLRNFKGEPLVAMADVLPDYWEKVRERFAQSDRPKPFSFRYRPTDQIWNGVYDPVNDRIEDLAATSRASVPDFFSQFGLEAPAALEDWRLEFAPTILTQYDTKAKFCNLWAPTKYMRLTTRCDVLPPKIEYVLRHVTGNDEVSYVHFLNWLAFAFQRREKTMVAWVLSGIEGTGKGVLYHNILVPLFGQKYCVKKQTGGLEDRFNADLGQCLIYNFNESKLETGTNAHRLYEKLKDMITDTAQEIRAMRTNSIQATNYTNFLITSNNYDAMQISSTDRRFNVAPRQENKIAISEADLATIDDELPQFAAYLLGYAVDVTAAHTALNNDAKVKMRDAGQTWLEQMCDALRDGNLSHFVSACMEESDSSTNIMAHAACKTVVKQWIVDALDGRPSEVTSGQLREVHAYMSGDSVGGSGPGKFSRMLAHKNIRFGEPRYRNGKSVRSLTTSWQVNPEELNAWRENFLAVGQGKQPASVDSKISPWKSNTN